MKAGVATHVCDSARIEELQDKLCSLDSPYPEDVSDVLNEFSKESTFDVDKEFVLKPVIPQIEKCFSGGSVEDILKNLEKVSFIKKENIDTDN